MRQHTLRWAISSAMAVAALVAGAPAQADVFTITLTNGTTFESRYLPEEAPYDSTKIVFLDALGLRMALPKEIVESVTSEAESTGFGKIIDTTTLDLGFLPNDLPTDEELAALQGQQPIIAGQQLPVYNMEQFVEPGNIGGLPVWGAGGGAGSYQPFPQQSVPFTPPPQVGAPPTPTP